ncbi:MAG: hypothetical protein HQK77_00695 [Desulfobacterales bacterium]|nr:hypothetical protein [Desulfobacterales bacterium]
MLEKAKQQIKEAAFSLGTGDRFRIDLVRKRTDLPQKVFDKTLRYLNDIGEIELYTGDTDDLSDHQLSNLLSKNQKQYVFFSYVLGREE